MTTNSITAEARTETKRSANQSLRRRGRIPGVVYGSQTESIAVHVDEKELARIARTGRSEMFKLQLEGNKDLSVIIKDFQKQKGIVSHVDFLQISENKTLRVRVPIDYQGAAAGSKEGGVVQNLVLDLEVEALPANLPSTIEVDISNLQIGDKLSASEVKLPEKVTLISPEDELLVTVSAPRTAEAAETEEAVDASGEAAATAEEAE